MHATKEQLNIQNSNCQLTIVDGNAGSGKTSAVAQIVAIQLAAGVRAEEILLLAFTPSGAEAYSRALLRLGTSKHTIAKLRIHTLEQFCLLHLNPASEWSAPYYTHPEKIKPIIMRAVELARTWADLNYPGQFNVTGDSSLSVESLLKEFSRLKGSFQLMRQVEGVSISPSTAVDLNCEFSTLAIFRAYELLRCNYADSDATFMFVGDGVYDFARLFEKLGPAEAADHLRLKQSYKLIVLDEMHDCNWAAFTVLRHLLRRNARCRFFGLGDRDQAIYSENAAEPTLMGYQFEEHIGQALRLPLTASYRFGANLSAALGFISEKPYRSASSTKTDVQFRSIQKSSEVLEAINYAKFLQKSQLKPQSGVAVLMNYHESSCQLEHMLRRSGVPYKTQGFTTYLRRTEVLFFRKLLMEALRVDFYMHETIDRAARVAFDWIVGGKLNLEGFGPTEASLNRPGIHGGCLV